MIQFDVQQIISQAFSFLILLWLLKRFAWRPLLQVLDSRQHSIEKALRESAQGRDEVERLKNEYNKQLANIESETRKKIQEAILNAKRISMEIQEQSRDQGNAIIAKAKETAELEVAKAKVSLRNQIVDMTMEAVERVLRSSLDAKRDRELIDSVVDEIEQEAGHS